MRVALWGTPVNHPVIAAHLAQIDGLEIVDAQGPDKLASALPGAEALLMPVRHFTAPVAQLIHQHGHTLKYLQMINAGYDMLVENPPPPGLLICTAGNSLAPAVGEHTIALFLALGRHLDVAMGLQARACWDDSIRGLLRVIDGRTVVVVGYGAIGREVAQRARALGAYVIGVRRSGGSDAHADEMVTPDRLDDVLARADRIAITCPLTDETRNLFNAARFAHVKPGAYLVNVARGGVVDTDALLAAMRSGIIEAAGLDVTEPEPLPPEHPLWSTPRVIITPHVSASDSNVRLARFLAANMRRYLAGQPLEAVLEDLKA